jgi:HSP20 family protein
MAIVRWTPGGWSNRNFLSEFDGLRSQMQNLFDNLATTAGGDALNRAGVYPLLNLSEDENNLYVTAELPGIDANELIVVVENDKLIIRGERKIQEQDKQVNIHRQERESGYFRRVLSLPVKVDTDKVSAMTRDGILEITLPKSLEAKPRQITVQAV